MRYLRDQGYDVLFILEFAPGSKDREVLSLATDQRRILITEDLDFGEVVFRDGLQAYAILQLCFDSSSRQAKAMRILEVIQSEQAQFAGYLVTVSEDKICLRKLLDLP